MMRCQYCSGTINAERGESYVLLEGNSVQLVAHTFCWQDEANDPFMDEFFGNAPKADTQSSVGQWQTSFDTNDYAYRFGKSPVGK